MSKENKKNQKEAKWFKNCVVYQIYPRSFYDTDGNGVGDLKGIAEKLDYLKDLGVGAIWLSPIYKSPMVDFGYDVEDYLNVDPIFGTLKDFDDLVEKAHNKEIKILLDYIPNHTSNKHKWFLESESSKDNPKRSWYIWREGKEGNPPNNWMSVFGGSAWEYDEKTESYYYHSFLKEQPDLNWRNLEVREVMKKALRFWMERKVDGFRVDVMYYLFKDSLFRNNPPNPHFVPGSMDPYQAQIHQYDQGQPETFNIIKEFCETLEEYGNKFMVTEVYVPIHELLPFFEACNPKIHAPFNMNLIGLPWDVSLYRNLIEEVESSLSFEDTPNYVLGNHDRPRVASRLGQERARLVAILQMTLRNMPFIYYGEEIGMEDVLLDQIDIHDPFEKKVPGMRLGRDPNRTPMQWSGERYAGFSHTKPWLPVSSKYLEHNVEKENSDPYSMLSLYKTLINFRNSSKTILYGDYKTMDIENQNILSYYREFEGENIVVILNFSEHSQPITFSHEYRIVCNTFLDRKAGDRVDHHGLILRPYEGYVLKKL